MADDGGPAEYSLARGEGVRYEYEYDHEYEKSSVQSQVVKRIKRDHNAAYGLRLSFAMRRRARR